MTSLTGGFARVEIVGLWRSVAATGKLLSSIGVNTTSERWDGMLRCWRLEVGCEDGQDAIVWENKKERVPTPCDFLFCTQLSLYLQGRLFFCPQ